jgi:glucokinase
MILAGDIGGTHTRMAFFQQENGQLKMVLERVYPSREHQGFDEIMSLFMSNQQVKIEAACFGIAGPVLNGRVSTPNLAWVVDSLQLAKQLDMKSVWLINDLHAHASGIDDLGQGDFINLNKNGPAVGNAALIAAGTGLGQAGLYWDGKQRHAFPCEGGHCDFAPRNEDEIALLQYLIKKFGRVSYERVVSGPGLKNIYEFLCETGREQEPAWLKDELQQCPDAAAAISAHGMEGKTAICERALDIFVSVYGAEAGNLALKLMAVGGVFLSGGIAAKMLPKLKAPGFREAFVSKGRLQPLMENIPVRVIINDGVGLIGAARYAVTQTALHG